MPIIIKKKPVTGAAKIVKPLPTNTPAAEAPDVDPVPAGGVKSIAPSLGASAKLVKSLSPKATAAPVAAQSHPVVETTTVTHPDGSESNQTKIIGGEMFEAPPASVSVTLGFTKNMGDYNSVRFSVTLMVPCANSENDIAQSYAFAKEWTDKRAEEVQNELGG